MNMLVIIVSVFLSSLPPSHSSTFADVARGGQAELLIGGNTVGSYFGRSHNDALLVLANQCRKSYLETGIAHVPNFVRKDVVDQMVQEATWLKDQQECFRSTEDHTVYQENQDPNYAASHPRNALQKSSKWIVDWDRLHQLPQGRSSSPLAALYSSPELRAFVSYVVRTNTVKSLSEAELFVSGCPYNSCYYNLYENGDGLGWHFDRSEFGVNLELQPAEEGGDFELCWGTRSTSSSSSMEESFEAVQSILTSSTPHKCPTAHRIENPPVGPGSLVLFAGSRNLHRVTPVGSPSSSKPRINAIMTYETTPNQKPNAYSLRKFFGR